MLIALPRTVPGRDSALFASNNSRDMMVSPDTSASSNIAAAALASSAGDASVSFLPDGQPLNTPQSHVITNTTIAGM